MIETSRVHVVDVSLGPARQTLRCSVMAGPDGAGVLTLAAGHGGADSDDPFLRASWMDPPLQLPAAALPKLRAALAELEAAGVPDPQPRK
jgi:hypothetical protein